MSLATIGQLELEAEHYRELFENGLGLLCTHDLEGRLLAIMSNELRTPLTAIIGFSDVLDEDEESPLTPQQKTYLGYVRKGARHLLELIDELLDLSKIAPPGEEPPG